MIKLKIQPDDIPCETDLKCSAMKALKKNLGRGTFEFLIWYFPLLDYKYITVQLYLLKDLKKNGNIFSFGSATWLVYQFKVNLGIELMTYSPMESYIPLRAIINISLFFFAAWQCSPTKMAGSIRPYC